jgi:Resolvase, N terminal domain
MNGSHKIASQHLTRPAIVYVRQSTLDQVRHHHESRRRQYQLAERARGLGWKEVSVIDEDLGKSGASSAKRTGFSVWSPRLGLAGSARCLASRSRAWRATIVIGTTCSTCAA